jgi:CheY-like chemotaxis protein
MDAQRCILVADNSANIREVLTTLLEDDGYRTVEAVDGQHALDLALSQHVDLIVLDLDMPRLNGHAFCAAYREHGGQAPVLLLTGSHREVVAAAVETCGAVGYILKPFELDEVLTTVERHLG